MYLGLIVINNRIVNKINVKKIEFSSIRYLKSMKKNAIRSVKFKKLI